MLRSAPVLLIGLLLALPAHGDEPPSDEPMHAPNAQTAPAAQPAPAAPAAQPAVAAQPAATAQPAAVGVSEEIIPNPPRVYGYGFGGAALGSLALGAILGGVALSKSNEQEGNPSSPTVYTRDLRDAGDQGRSLAVGSYVFLGVGIALAVTDVVLWYEIFRKPRVIRRNPDGSILSGAK